MISCPCRLTVWGVIVITVPEALRLYLECTYLGYEPTPAEVQLLGGPVRKPTRRDAIPKIPAVPAVLKPVNLDPSVALRGFANQAIERVMAHAPARGDAKALAIAYRRDAEHALQKQIDDPDSTYNRIGSLAAPLAGLFALQNQGAHQESAEDTQAHRMEVVSIRSRDVADYQDVLAYPDSTRWSSILGEANLTDIFSEVIVNEELCHPQTPQV
jgi:hypothetical protein